MIICRHNNHMGMTSRLPTRMCKRHVITICIIAVVSLIAWTVAVTVNYGDIEVAKWPNRHFTAFSRVDVRGSHVVENNQLASLEDRLSTLEEFPWIQRQNYLPNFYTNRRRKSSNVGFGDSIWPPEDYYSNGTVVYLHHHKAAGSSVRQCISDMKPLISLKTVSHESHFEIFESLKSNDSFVFKTYVGGYSFGICDFVLDRPCSYFTVLRDPYERIISAYKYCKIYTRDHICWGKKAKTSSLKDWVKYHKSFLFYQLLFRPDFCQRDRFVEARHLEGTSQGILPCWYIQHILIDSIINDDAKRVILDYIMANLENWFSVIGLTDEFELSLRMFEDVFSLPFKRCHSLNLKGNMTKLSKTNITKYKEFLMSDPSVNNILYYDLEIYGLATKIFAKQKKVYFQRTNDLATQNLQSH